MGFGKGALLVAAAMAMTGGFGLESQFTATKAHKEPDNRGRRAEKSAERLAKAEEKRKRRASKRLADCSPEEGEEK